MKLPKLFLLVLLTSLCLLGSFSTAHAVITPEGDVTPWTPPNPLNWTSSTTAHIGNTSSGTVTVDSGSDLISDDAYLASSTGSTGNVTVDGAGSTWSYGDALYVGDVGNGTLNITNGGSVYSGYSNTYIGYYSGSAGTVTVDGAGSIWNVGGDIGYLTIGRSGSGTLNITNGGNFICTMCYISSMSGSSGTLNITNGGDSNTLSCSIGSALGTKGLLTVDGVGSTLDGWFYVGDSGSGTLSITNGGSANGAIWIGFNRITTGLVTVDGAGSTLTSNSLCVGEGGSGTLSITNGGSVNVNINGNISIGRNSTSTGLVTVDGAGSTLINGNLYVGVNGSGTLSITNGGSVNNASCYIASSTGSGMVTVDGAGSTWTNSGDLYIGYTSTGIVTQTGGSNSVTGNFYLSYKSTGNGTYNLNGGTLILKSLSKGSGTAAFNFGGGTLLACGPMSCSLPMTLSGTGGNANVNSNGYTVTLSGDLSGTGGLTKLGTGALILTGTNTYTGRTTINASGGSTSAVILGTAAQNVVVNLVTGFGGADIQAGKMYFEPCGIATVEQIKTLLAISNAHGWINPDDKFIISTYTAGHPILGWTDEAVAPECLGVSMTTDPTVMVMRTYAGDFDLSGEVDGLDLQIWKLNIANPLATWKNGNANYDDSIDGSDLEIWKLNFGKKIAGLVVDGPSFSESGVTGAAVPEPGTLVMLLAVALGLSIRVWRKRC